jgi:hypothetical protein
LKRPIISAKTLRFYGIWALIGVGIMGLVMLMLQSLEWRPVYQYYEWYREHPAPEEDLTATVVRNPTGENRIRIFLHENGTIRIADKGEKAPKNSTFIYREYSYKLVFPTGETIDIYGAGADTMQIRLLSGLEVDIIGKRVWFEVEGHRIKEEFWPKRLRVSDPA